MPSKSNHLADDFSRLNISGSRSPDQNAPRSRLLALPAELRNRIYIFICKDIYIDRLGRKAAENAELSNTVVLNILLTCKTFHTELPPVIPEVITVSIRTRDMLALDRQLDCIPMTLKLIPTLFRSAKNIVGHWSFFPNQWLTNVGTPSIPIDVIKYGSFSWKRIRMVATIRLHDQIYSRPPNPAAALTRFSQTIERGIREHLELKDYLVPIPGVEVTVEINIWSEKLQSFVGKFLVTGGWIDRKMWRIAVPEEAHVMRVLHDILGLKHPEDHVD